MVFVPDVAFEATHCQCGEQQQKNRKFGTTAAVGAERDFSLRTRVSECTVQE